VEDGCSSPMLTRWSKGRCSAVEGGGVLPGGDGDPGGQKGLDAVPLLLLVPQVLPAVLVDRCLELPHKQGAGVVGVEGGKGFCADPQAGVGDVAERVDGGLDGWPVVDGGEGVGEADVVLG
jgi:hypothetical protein